MGFLGSRPNQFFLLSLNLRTPTRPSPVLGCLSRGVGRTPERQIGNTGDMGTPSYPPTPHELNTPCVHGQYNSSQLHREPKEDTSAVTLLRNRPSPKSMCATQHPCPRQIYSRETICGQTGSPYRHPLRENGCSTRQCVQSSFTCGAHP